MARNVPLTDAEKELIREYYAELRAKGMNASDAEECTALKLGLGTRTVRKYRVIPESLTSADFEEPEGFVKGRSVLYDADGKVKLQWVKTDNKYDPEQFKEWAQNITEGLPRVRPITAPEHTVDDLLAIYPMGDPHVGMMAWGVEAGSDFDLKIAEQDLCDAVDYLVQSSPRCTEALVISVGDMFHSDNKNAHTTNSLHTLDVDSRYGKVLEVGVRAFRRCIESALEHHSKVTVICALGNHDWHTSTFLSVILKHIYETEPRVTVMDTFAPRTYFRFYNSLIGVTHGDKVKAEALPLLMASERKEDWGETAHRAWITGHVHHLSIKEFVGCTVETFNTLAPRDAWHAEMGYLSQRNMKALIHHKEFGEVARHIVSVDMLRSMQEKSVV